MLTNYLTDPAIYRLYIDMTKWCAVDVIVRVAVRAVFACERGVGALVASPVAVDDVVILLATPLPRLLVMLIMVV